MKATRRRVLGLAAVAAMASCLSARADGTYMDEEMAELVRRLRSIGSDPCLEAAANFEMGSSDISFRRSLHLRNAGLNVSHARLLAKSLSRLSVHDDQPIRSLSVSYNPLLGDVGALLFARSMPRSISEIGFVGCGISDKGGEGILEWAKLSTHVSMICIEGNLLSNRIKADFRKLREHRSDLLVVV